MSAEIIISAMALAGSLAAAGVAWLQATKTARIAAQTQMTYEQMKIDHDRRVKAFEATAAEVAPVEHALATTWEQLQRAKEAISQALSSTGDHEAASLVLVSLTSEITDGYAAFGVHLSSAARGAWHRAKKLIATSAPLAASPSIRDPEGHGRSALSALRDALTDIQSILSVERISLRVAAVDRVARML